MARSREDEVTAGPEQHFGLLEVRLLIRPMLQNLMAYNDVETSRRRIPSRQVDYFKLDMWKLPASCLGCRRQQLHTPTAGPN